MPISRWQQSTHTFWPSFLKSVQTNSEQIRSCGKIITCIILIQKPMLCQWADFIYFYANQLAFFCLPPMFSVSAPYTCPHFCPMLQSPSVLTCGWWCLWCSSSCQLWPSLCSSTLAQWVTIAVWQTGEVRDTHSHTQIISIPKCPKQVKIRDVNPQPLLFKLSHKDEDSHSSVFWHYRMTKDHFILHASVFSYCASIKYAAAAPPQLEL